MKKYTAEFIGTFALVFCGTGAIVIHNQMPAVLTHAGIAATFGLIVMAMIYTVGNISGAHLNPAVSISLVVAKKLEAKQLLPYILSQLSGAFAASILLHYLFPNDAFLGTTLPSGTWQQSFILEFLLTFFLMLTIYQVASEKLAGFIIGGIVGLEAMFAGPICGASMNPARSIAPAIVSGHTEYLGVYIAAPIIGALVALVLFRFLKPD